MNNNMPQEHKLSLSAAILINVNIMLGAGIFVNTAELAKRAGMLGGFCYLIVGGLMLPLVIAIAAMLRLHPEGGFYTFGEQQIRPFAGFISSWSYFTGKLASATLMIHTSVLMIQALIPAAQSINIFVLDLIILAIFIALNMFNIKTSSQIQGFLFGFKIIPIIFIILGGLFLFSGHHMTASHFVWSGVPTTLPLILYATVGFEAACSLSSKIKNAKKNAARAVLISYGAVIFVTFLYQFFFYGALGNILAAFADYRQAFPAFLHLIVPENAGGFQLLNDFFYLAIAASALGGAYSIIFSNNWNLYTLAQNNHIFFANVFRKFNRHHIPWLCVLLEGLICILYLAITQGSQIPLQEVSALGCIIAYTISVLALTMAKKRRLMVSVSWWVPILGLVNCGILITACVYGLIQTGGYSLITFGILFLLGIWMFWRKRLTAHTTVS